MTEVFRDRWLLVVDKPHGLPTQADGEDDLYGRLRAREAYVGLHHRLDQPASGLLLLTLDTEVNAAIAADFREHRIERRYAAVLVGEAAEAVWDRPLDGAPARTHLRPLARANGMTAAELRLETGRTHQIRRHAAMAGTPVAGDKRYGGDAGRAWPRLALHAAELRLRHPVTGEPLVLRSPIPADLARLWALAGG